MFATAQVTKATMTNSSLWSMRRQRSASHSATASAESTYGQKTITHCGMRATPSGLGERTGDEEYGARAHDAFPVPGDIAVAEGKPAALLLDVHPRFEPVTFAGGAGKVEAEVGRDEIGRRRGRERHGVAERDV